MVYGFWIVLGMVAYISQLCLKFVAVLLTVELPKRRRPFGSAQGRLTLSMCSSSFSLHSNSYNTDIVDLFYITAP
ncbi:hypothetical protein JYT72_02215, partial [Crocinitomix catalasitica]|nr:hypothetical protein [Crocinitomix catalasitica]